MVNLKTELAGYGITEIYGMLPEQFSHGKVYLHQRIFHDGRWWFSLVLVLVMREVVLVVTISGLSNLQMPSLIANCCSS
jgi:hypothetical protein